MANTIASLMVKIGGDISDLEKSLSKASRKMQDAGKQMQRVGRAMTTAVTLPMAAMGAASVKAAGNFEDSFADIRKTVDATEPVFQQMSEEIRDLSKTVPTSVEELNRLGGVAGQLGVEANNIVDFTKVIAQLGDTTDIAGEQAALSLSRFMNVMGTAEGDIDRLGSTIVGLGNNFAAMESEIVDISTSMAPLGNSIGLTEQNVLALSAAIAASGGEAKAASTAFQKTANTMQRAVLEGTEDLEVFARTAGMTTEQFRKAFEEDSFEALITFMEGLRRTQQEGESMAAVLDEIGLADQRLIREFGKVVGNLDQVREAAGMANQEWDRNTALTEEAQKRYKTFNSQMQIFWNTVKDLGITIGNALIPAVTRLTDVAKGAIGVFQNFGPIMKGVTLVFSGLVAITGPVIWFFGTMAVNVGRLITAMPKLVASVKALNTALFKNPYTAVAAAIVGLGVVSYKTAQQIGTLNEKIKEALNFDASGKSLEAVNKQINEVAERIKELNRTAANTRTGILSPGDQERLENLENKLEDLIDKRDSLAQKQLFNDRVTQGLQDVEEFLTFITTDFSELVSTAEQADIAKPFVEAKKPADDIILALDMVKKKFKELSAEEILSDVGEVNLGEKIAPPGSMAFLNQEIQRFQEKLAYATDPARIEQFQNKIADLKLELSGQTKITNALKGVTDSFTSAFGQGLNNLIVGAKNLREVLGNIGRLLLSSAIQTAISALLTGGLGGSGFFGKGGGLFGSIFGVDDALITSEDDVVQFHPDDNILAMKDFSSLMPSMENAFGPTMAVVGNNMGVRSEAPLSKLKDMIGGTQRVQVDGKIRGDTIHLANVRGQNKFR